MEIIVAVVASLGLAAQGFPALEDALDKINIMQREHAGQFARQVRVDIAVPAMVIRRVGCEGESQVCPVRYC